MKRLEGVRRVALKVWAIFLDIFSDVEDPNEPFYDPVHLGAVTIVCLVVIGALYWLLWTLLVYEGGIFIKIRPALSILFMSKTLKDYGYEASPYAMGVFAGWIGNLAALLICVLATVALTQLYRSLENRARSRP